MSDLEVRFGGMGSPPRESGDQAVGRPGAAGSATDEQSADLQKVTAEPALQLSGVSKSFGTTRAVVDASLTVRPGEMVGLVGHNGAGKTTLAKIIAGLVVPDAGTIRIAGSEMPPGYSAVDARRHGVAYAMQEITLCPDLRVEENAGLANPELLGIGWKRRVRALLDDGLSRIFPGHEISPRSTVSLLSLAEQQMLQVVLAAFSVPRGARLLIVDEPTSALPHNFAESLFAYLREAKTAHELAVLLVSHKMADILEHTDRTVVMRDGQIVADHVSKGLQMQTVLESMQGPATTPRAAAVTGPAEAGPRKTRDDAAPEILSLSDAHGHGLRHVSLRVRRGEIVGLAGLEGGGQREVLRLAWRSRRQLGLGSVVRGGVTLRGHAAYVSGDRQLDGLFPLWTIQENTTISSLHNLTKMGLLSRRRERAEAVRWSEQMAVRAKADTPVTRLSGGTQQKILLARGLAREPDLLLLDDPFRGVDITTKTEAYTWLRREAAAGKAILWYSTENSELLECDVVYVFRGHHVAAILTGEDLTLERLIAESFEEVVEGPTVN